MKIKEPKRVQNSALPLPSPASSSALKIFPARDFCSAVMLLASSTLIGSRFATTAWTSFACDARREMVKLPCAHTSGWGWLQCSMRLRPPLLSPPRRHWGYPSRVPVDRCQDEDQSESGLQTRVLRSSCLCQFSTRPRVPGNRAHHVGSRVGLAERVKTHHSHPQGHKGLEVNRIGVTEQGVAEDLRERNAPGSVYRQGSGSKH